MGRLVSRFCSAFLKLFTILNRLLDFFESVDMVRFHGDEGCGSSSLCPFFSLACGR